MDIKILGSGCANCDKLEDVTRQAVERCEVDATFEKVSDMTQIMAFGVMTTPALVIDGEVKVAGRVPDVDGVMRILGDACADTGGCGCDGCCC